MSHELLDTLYLRSSKEMEFTKSMHNPSRVSETCNGISSHVLQIVLMIIFQLIMEEIQSEVAQIKIIWTCLYLQGHQIAKKWLIAKNYSQLCSNLVITRGQWPFRLPSDRALRHTRYDSNYCHSIKRLKNLKVFNNPDFVSTKQSVQSAISQNFAWTDPSAPYRNPCQDGSFTASFKLGRVG